MPEWFLQAAVVLGEVAAYLVIFGVIVFFLAFVF
jgi:hypothetical protein